MGKMAFHFIFLRTNLYLRIKDLGLPTSLGSSPTIRPLVAAIQVSFLCHGQTKPFPVSKTVLSDESFAYNTLLVYPSSNPGFCSEFTFLGIHSLKLSACHIKKGEVRVRGKEPREGVLVGRLPLWVMGAESL